MGEGLESTVVNPADKKILNVPSPKGGGVGQRKKLFFIPPLKKLYPLPLEGSHVKGRSYENSS